MNTTDYEAFFKEAENQIVLNIKTHFLETELDGGAEKPVRRATGIACGPGCAGNGSVHPGFVHRRQVQLGRHGAVRYDLVFLLVAEHVVHHEVVRSRRHHAVRTVDVAAVDHDGWVA